GRGGGGGGGVGGGGGRKACRFLSLRPLAAKIGPDARAALDARLRRRAVERGYGGDRRESCPGGVPVHQHRRRGVRPRGPRTGPGSVAAHRDLQAGGGSTFHTIRLRPRTVERARATAEPRTRATVR